MGAVPNEYDNSSGFKVLEFRIYHQSTQCCTELIVEHAYASQSILPSTKKKGLDIASGFGPQPLKNHNTLGI